jgi:hypothetical protein
VSPVPTDTLSLSLMHLLTVAFNSILLASEVSFEYSSDYTQRDNARDSQRIQDIGLPSQLRVGKYPPVLTEQAKILGRIPACVVKRLIPLGMVHVVGDSKKSGRTRYPTSGDDYEQRENLREFQEISVHE